VKGKVYLVGAGPGDPDLLTLKALRLLKIADAVLYDDLVSEEVLNLVSSAAQLHHVGKRCGAKRISQAEINFLMVVLASSGLTVVRLKSGDPLIFGRAGEELEGLRRANIECEIVPGITAALGAAAAAQIPLTHRHVSHALVFLTGHTAEAGDSDDADWGGLVCNGATLAIYMPGKNYAELAARLKKAGLPLETPCAVISAALTPDQEMEFSTVGELSAVRHLGTPALVLAGRVVSLARNRARDHTPASYDLQPRLQAMFSETRQFAANEETA
jgi:uroporphyrin-III C-methyltransferase